jgi:peptidoglycan/xylan/chitin deacetylase (PgdA/CDA1 family)
MKCIGGSANFARRFACFTFDDGYRDNRDYALPVMREFDAPLTVYVASDFAEGTGRCGGSRWRQRSPRRRRSKCRSAAP